MESTGYAFILTESDMPRLRVTIVMISITLNFKSVSLKRSMREHSSGISDDVMFVVLLPSLGLFDMCELNSHQYAYRSDSSRSSTWPRLLERY